MSTKLIIHKFNSDVEVLTMNVIIEGEDKDSKTYYSDWSEKETHANNALKSSRLIVKIVNEETSHHLKLDNCAQIINNSELFNAGTLNNTNLIQPNTFYRNNFENNDYFDDFNGVPYKDRTINMNDEQTYIDLYNVTNGGIGDINGENKYHNNTIEVTPRCATIANSYENTNSDLNPLEYSLKKIKENNAHIMENIHKLNRTLNYTKDKEFIANFYPKTTRTFPCSSCGKCFVYETGLKRHFAIRHCSREMIPRWEAVWTCAQCFQVWPRQDLAFKHSTLCCKTDNMDCIREIKTSSLLQCEFCEKVFTSIPCLLKHSKIHTTNNYYECNPCEEVFVSYKAAEQHWLICPFLKICYNFSLPKMLPCNICDRKFKNYEQLYNHRYKVNHFTTKNHSDMKNLGMLVYQCEICGLWLKSVQLLQNHRQNSHRGYEGVLEENTANSTSNNMIESSDEE